MIKKIIYNMDSLKKMLKDTAEYSNNNEKILFVIIKPGFLNLTKEVCIRMKKIGWNIKRMKTKKLLLKEARELYKIHKKEDWYNDLCNYMCSDITTAILFNKNGQTSRNDFKEMDNLKDEIRNEFGESDMRNVIHSSDSFKNLIHEAGIYFESL